MRASARIVAAAVATVASRTVYRALQIQGQTRQILARSNHRGGAVTLAQGPAFVLGALAAEAVSRQLPSHVRGAALLSIASSGAFGAFDDLSGATATKGLRGHLMALSRGQLTSGAVKVFGIGGTGLICGAWARGGRGGVIDATLSGVVVAGSANLLNLFDLRPGRASKLFLAVALPAAFSPGIAGDAVAGPAGAVVALIADDLGERSMLGDTGSNALGAVAGVALAAGASRRLLLFSSTSVVALTLASERVSFTKFIDDHHILRTIDAFGHRPSS